MKIIRDLFSNLLKCIQNCWISIIKPSNHNKIELEQSLVELNQINIESSHHSFNNNQKQQLTLSNKQSIKKTHFNQSSTHLEVQLLNSGSEVYHQKNIRKSLQIKSKLPQHKTIQNIPINRNKQKIINDDHISYNKLKHFQSSSIVSSARHSGTQSFQTIKSSLSRPISRRNFKLLRESHTIHNKQQQKLQEFYSVNQSQNSSVGQGHITTKLRGFNQNYRTNNQDVGLMNSWFKLEYQKYTPSSSLNYKQPILSEITKMKLQTKDSFDIMVHRLEDYYTFYYDYDDHLQMKNQGINHNKPMGQLQKKYSQQSSGHIKQELMMASHSSFWYEQTNHQLVCSVNRTDFTKSFDYEKTCKYMSLIVIPNCGLSAIKFLQWFNQLEVQSIFYSFNRIQYLQNSQRVNQNLTLEYPLVKVEQFGQELNGKQTYILARQIENVQFENQDQESVMETCFQAINEDKSYERLIRITSEANGTTKVQIYTQSSQNIKKQNNFFENMSVSTNYQFQYFLARWKKFQEKLNKDKIINKRVAHVYAN